MEGPPKSLELEDRMEWYKEDMPEKYHDVFEELVGEGKSPKVVGAAIDYINRPVTQKKISKEWGVTPPGLRNNLARIQARIDVPEIKSPYMETQREALEDLIDLLDWEEDVQYSTSASGYPNRITKVGVIHVRDTIEEFLTK